MAVPLATGIDLNIILLEKYISKEVFHDGSSINSTIKEYIKDVADPTRLSDLFFISYNSGACTWRRLAVILILLHFRLEYGQEFGPLLYNLGLIIQTSNSRNPNRKPQCTESSQGVDNVENKHMLNYFKDVCLHVSPTLEVTTSYQFTDMINNLSEGDFNEIVQCMYSDGNATHKTIIRLLIMYHMMLKRANVDKWKILTSFSKTLCIG